MYGTASSLGSSLGSRRVGEDESAANRISGTEESMSKSKSESPQPPTLGLLGIRVGAETVGFGLSTSAELATCRGVGFVAVWCRGSGRSMTNAATFAQMRVVENSDPTARKKHATTKPERRSFRKMAAHLQLGVTFEVWEH